MLATHTNAESRYTKLREIALQTAQRTFQNFDKQNIRVTTITHAALTESIKWDQSRNRLVDWDWANGHQFSVWFL